jgi:hypothetical protein
MVTKNDIETEIVIKLQYGIVAIEAYLQFEHAVSVLKIYFRFRLLQLNYRQCLDE